MARDMRKDEWDNLTGKFHDELEAVELKIDEARDKLAALLNAAGGPQKAVDVDSRWEYVVAAVDQLEYASRQVSGAARELNDIDEPE